MLSLAIATFSIHSVVHKYAHLEYANREVGIKRNNGGNHSFSKSVFILGFFGQLHCFDFRTENLT